MRVGGGKAKGSQFEREVCKRLSLWVTQGKEEDVYWRSAMSGGRSTRMHKSRHWKQGSHAAGDICAVGEAGHVFTDRFYVECKHYADLSILAFLLGKKEGLLYKFWITACREAEKHKKAPFLVAQQNRLPSMVIAQPQVLADEGWESWPCAPVLTMFHDGHEVGLWWFKDLCPYPILKPQRRTG